MRIVRLVLLFLSLLTTTASAQTTPPGEAIGAVRELILYARYDEAVVGARAYLDRNDLTAAQRNVGLEVLATAHIANRDTQNAEPVLRELYTRDPEHRLSDPDASPLVQGAFARARESTPPPVRVQLLNESPVVLSRRESPTIVVHVATGRDAVEEVRLSYRSGTTQRYTHVVMNVEDDGRARAMVPLVGTSGQSQQVSYFVHAMAPSAAPLARLGSESEPLSVTIPAAFGPAQSGAEMPAAVDRERPPSFATTTATTPGDDVDEEPSRSKWWVGVLVGAIVVGAGVGLYIGLGPPSRGPEGTLGSVDLL